MREREREIEALTNGWMDGRTDLQMDSLSSLVKFYLMISKEMAGAAVR